MVLGVRGAICLSLDEPEAVRRASNRLVNEICAMNGLAEEDIVSIVFSVTPDVKSANPAACLRRNGFSHTPLFCVQEAAFEGSMARVIRVLLTAEKSLSRGTSLGKARRAAVHVYLDGAEALRPDLGA
jgi:chorismate mutase